MKYALYLLDNIVKLLIRALKEFFVQIFLKLDDLMVPYDAEAVLSH
jgi:hypothetical protein